MQLSLTLGFLLSYSVGPYVDPMILAAVSGAVPIAFLVAFFPMPESPYVLVARDDNEGASRTLAWLRGLSRSQVSKELMVIQVRVLITRRRRYRNKLARFRDFENFNHCYLEDNER